MKNYYSLLLFYWLCLTSVSFAQTTISYTESTDIIANPERGLQKYSITNNNYNTVTNYSNINTTTISGWRTGSDKVTVIFRYFLLNAFLNSDISNTYLSNMQNDFNNIRTAGLKCIIRFSYSNAEGDTEQQPQKSQILKHITQLAPLLETNKDIILTHQAGFIGTWGEWYYTNSEEFGTDGAISNMQWQNRKEIVDAMLNATPLNIPIQVRYPQIKKTMYGNTTLTSATAYQNTPNARIGFFNDAFLNEWGDMGTYSVNSQTQNPIGTADYIYLSNETLYTPMTGETNGVNAPRTDGANALNEMNLTNWSTLNRDYYEQNFTNWIQSNHYNDILRNLGYRYVLNSTTITSDNSSLDISISLENKGYARLFTPRKVWLILKHSTTSITYPFLLQTDPRTWESQVNITQTIDISSLPDGIYNSYIHLPDSDPSLAPRPEYSIQFANTDIWETNTGYNKLLQNISINRTITDINHMEENNGISIYPNPASSQVYIKSTDLSTKQIELVTTTGKVLKTVYSSSIDTQLDISDVKPGLYLIHISSNDKKNFFNLLIQ